MAAHCSPPAEALTCSADKKYTKKDGDEEEEDGSRPAFAPRAHAKKVHEAAKYKDRAALRRAGGDGEYKEVRARWHHEGRR